MPMNELLTEAMHAVEDAINSVPNDDGDQNDRARRAAPLPQHHAQHRHHGRYRAAGLCDRERPRHH